MSGIVYLVGAGPGDPGLITVRGRDLLGRADVVVADRLVAPALLERLRAGVEIIVRDERDAMPQGEINRILVERARAGKRVVRLKGGDPFVFGRGGEEAEALAAAGVAFEVVPGVTAGVAVPSYAGIPLTQRGIAGAVVLVTGHELDGKEAGHVDWHALAAARHTTLVFYMSVTHLDAICARLVAAGRSPSTPVAVIAQGTTPAQRTVAATLADIAARVRAAGIAPPALTIVGDVVGLRQHLDWFESRPLHGRRILSLQVRSDPHDELDRPRRGEEIEPVARLGAELVVAAPLHPLAVRAQLQAAIARLARYRWVAFTSGNAVDRFFEELDAAGLDGRALAGLRAASLVGTASRLRLRLRPDLTAAGGGRELARALLDARIEGPVLFPRAEHGRDELPDALRAAGVEVDVVAAYTLEPDPAVLAHVLDDHRRRPFAAIALSNPRTAELFLDGAPALAGVLIGAIGSTTAEVLVGRGVPVDVVASTPSREVLLGELARALARRLDLG